MKKVFGLLVAACLSVSVFAQVLESQIVKNTLSTGFGMPYGQVNSDRDNLIFYGFTDTTQVRLDIDKFTVEGMLNWGAFPVKNGFVFQNTERTPFWYTNHFWYGDYGQGRWWTNGNTESYYVNFLFHPVKGLDIGMGTRLNWKIGPAPSSMDNYWGPKAHVVQGGLKDALPGKADVSGFVYYANKYTSNYHNGIVKDGQFANASIGIRYRYNDLFEIGAAVPSWPDYNNAKFNLAFNLHPIDQFSVYIAYDGILQSSYSNLYTGLSLFFNNFTWDLYFAGNFRPEKDGYNNNVLGIGTTLTFLVPSIHFTAAPEFGVTINMNQNYTPACYLGSRFDFVFADRFNLGTWISVAWGSSNKNWDANYFNGGFIFNVRPDFTWSITDHHDLSIYFDYQNRFTFDKRNYDVWGSGLYWTYKL